MLEYSKTILVKKGYCDSNDKKLLGYLPYINEGTEFDVYGQFAIFSLYILWNFMFAKKNDSVFSTLYLMAWPIMSSYCMAAAL